MCVCVCVLGYQNQFGGGIAVRFGCSTVRQNGLIIVSDRITCWCVVAHDCVHRQRLRPPPFFLSGRGGGVDMRWCVWVCPSPIPYRFAADAADSISFKTLAERNRANRLRDVRYFCVVGWVGGWFSEGRKRGANKRKLCLGQQ